MFPMYWKSDNNKTQQCRTEIFQKQSSPWDINLLPVVKIKAVKITESLGYAEVIWGEIYFALYK